MFFVRIAKCLQGQPGLAAPLRCAPPNTSSATRTPPSTLRSWADNPRAATSNEKRRGGSWGGGQNGRLPDLKFVKFNAVGDFMGESEIVMTYIPGACPIF